MILATSKQLKFTSRAAEKFALVAVGILFVWNVVLLSWYLFVGYREHFHSDSAMKVLLANEIFTTGDYFPDNWTYANKDLAVFFGHTFIVPLLLFLPAGYLTHAIAGLASSFLILLGAWLVSGELSISPVRRLLIVTIFASGISLLMAENLYGQVSYGAVFYHACYLVFFSLRFLQSEGRKSIAYGVAVLLVLLAVFWANPIRAGVFFFLPLVGAVILSVWKSCASVDIRRPLSLLAITCSGAASGAFLHYQTLGGVFSNDGAGSVKWLSYELMLRNISQIPNGLLAVLGSLPQQDAPILGLGAVYTALRLFAGVSALLLIPVVTCQFMTKRTLAESLVGNFVAISAICGLFPYITTTLPAMNDPIQSIRYLVPVLCFGIILLSALPLRFKTRPLKSLTVCVILFVFATSSYSAFLGAGRSLAGIWGQPGQFNSQHSKLAKFLVAENFRYGFATFWNAGVISVLSNGESLVRQVDIQAGLPVPMRWHGSDSWFCPSAWRGSTFLLLTEAEAQQVDWERMRDAGLNPSAVEFFEGFVIVSFDRNIAGHLPGWQRENP